MTSHPAADERLSGRKSLRLLFVLLAAMLAVAFFGELAIMFALPYLLPADAGEWRRTLLDAGLLAAVMTVALLPLMLHFRQRNLRVARRALRLQYTLDQHAIVSITDVAGRITFANDRFCDISGYTRQELIGQNHRLLKSGQHPPEVFVEMWRTIAQGHTWHGEICNRNKTGDYYWVNATITPFLDERGKPEEYIAIRTEITTQKALEKASRQQEAWLRTILDNLGEGVYTLDAHGKLDYLNAEAERLLGWRREELAGKGLHDIIHHHRPDGRALPAGECPVHLAMLEHRVFRSGDEVFFHRDGTPLPIKITAAPLALEGEWQGSVAVFSDMREERLLNQRLLEAKDSAEEAARLKTDFLSTMSHEIRTPLNGVIGMTDLLLDTPLDNEQTEFARTIKMSADALMAIINDILDLSKIEAGRLQLEHTGFSLHQIVEGSLDVLAAKAHEKGLTLASFIDLELPDHVIGDPTRIRQILLNFLSNAIKFTESGEVVVSVHGAALGAGAADDERHATIKFAVRDSGIGLSEKAKSRLFQPFSQTDSSTTRKYGGTGLGLSICKRLAEAMGGQVGVDSATGQGSTFWAQISLELADEKRANIPAASILRGRQVLVAGGGAASRAIWRSYLEAWQVQGEAVANLAELRQRLAELQGQGLAPDAVLLAQPLPDATLGEAVAVLQAERPRLPLVCCLDQPEREMKSALAAQGVIVMQGPLKQSTLVSALLATLGKAQPSPGRRMSDLVDRAASGGAIAGRPHLLLAEDNPVNQRVAVHMLNKLGYAVDVVDNGALAVAAVAAGSYALVLMDCQMPEMDGFAATAAIRRAEASSRRHLPIVAMTANALQGDREQCLAAGMDDYIAKPIVAARLSALLAGWLPEGEVTAPPALPLPAAGSISERTFAGSAVAIDLKRLTDLFDDDEAVIDELLTVFGQSLPPLCQRLQHEVGNHGDALKNIAHEFRGAAANVGALPLAELAGQLERLAASGNWSEIAALATRIDAEAIRAADFISHYIGRRKA